MLWKYTTGSTNLRADDGVDSILVQHAFVVLWF